MLEHCRILPSGKMRVIFDTDSKDNFEKRVWARYKNLYHRGDPVQKQEVISKMREEYTSKKAEKRSKYKQDKADRKSKQDEIKKQIEAVERWNKRPGWQKFLIKTFRKNENKNTN